MNKEQVDLAVIVPAAGCGRRMAAGVNKVFLELDGVPILIHNLKELSKIDFIVKVIIVVKRDELTTVKEMLDNYAAQYSANLNCELVVGGEERQDSVINALALVEERFVAVHDAARPFATLTVFERVLAAAKISGAAVAGVAMKDTVKVVDGSQQVISTMERSTLRAIQTPQIFETVLLKNAYALVRQKGINVTDDAGAVEIAGGTVVIAEGDYRNNKITTREDLVWAEELVKEQKRYERLNWKPPLSRTGIGYDVHRFKAGRKLILCGVEIPHIAGLEGHSDADVAVHAIIDALLGAAGLGDIGLHFPDTDDKYKGADSLKLLCVVKELLTNKDWSIGNIDVTIIAEEPKLVRYRGQMTEKLASVLGISVEAVNIKATTNEKMGFLGRSEGVAAHAVAVLWHVG